MAAAACCCCCCFCCCCCCCCCCCFCCRTPRAPARHIGSTHCSRQYTLHPACCGRSAHCSWQRTGAPVGAAMGRAGRFASAPCVSALFGSEYRNVAGLRARAPATPFGVCQQAAKQSGCPGAFSVSRSFVDKPPWPGQPGHLPCPGRASSRAGK